MKHIRNATVATMAAAAALTACNDHSFVPLLEEIVASAAGLYSGALTDDPDESPKRFHSFSRLS